MKTPSSFYLLLILIFPCWCNISFAQTPGGGLLWEVTGNGLTTPSYIYGTVHLRHPMVFQLPDSVYVAIQSADAFALEFDMDSMQHFMCAYMATKDTEDSSWEKLLNHTDRLISEKSSRREKESIEPPIGLQDHILDLYLYFFALRQGKEIEGLESYRDQLDFLESRGSWSRETDTLSPMTMYQLTEHYVRQDLGGIADLIGDFVDIEPMVVRNRIMLENFKRISATTSLFGAVGTGHLLGENGLINLLRKEGYQLRSVGNSSLLPPHDISVSDKKNWETLYHNGGRYQVDFPEAPCVSYTEDGQEFYISTDLQTNEMYALGVMVATPGLDARQLSKALETNFIKSGLPKEFLEIKRIRQNDIGGVHIKLLFGDPHMEYRCFLHEGVMYFLMHIQTGGKPDNSRLHFFDSFRLIPHQDVTSFYTSSRGTFQVNLPGEPFYQRIQYPTEIPDESFAIHQYVYGKENLESQFVVQFFEMRPDQIFRQEAVLMESILSELSGEGVMEAVPLDIDFDEAIMDSTMLVRFMDNTYLTYSVLAYNGKVYILANTAKKKENAIANVQGIITLLPVQTPTAQPVSVWNGECTAIVPGALQPATDSLFYFESHTIDLMTSVMYYDTISSTMVVFDQVHLSPYYEHPWSDSLTAEWNVLFHLDTDSTSIENRTWLQTPSKRIVTHSSGNLVRVTEYMQANGKLYAMTVYLPASLYEKGEADKYILSFSLRPSTEPAFAMSKGELLLKNLKDENELRHASALSAVPYIDFTSTELDTIAAFLLQPWPDDSTYASTREELMLAYLRHRGKDADPVLMAMGKQVGEQDMYVYELVHQYFLMHTEPSLALAKDILLLDGIREDMEGYTVFRSYHDSLSLLAQHLPGLIPFLQHDQLSWQLAGLCRNLALDTTAAYREVISTYHNEFKTKLLARIEEAFQDSIDEENAWVAEDEIESLWTILGSTVPYTEIQMWADTLLQLENRYIDMTVLLHQLKNNVPYDTVRLKEIFMDTFYAYSALYLATNLDMVSQIPADVLKEEVVARCEFIDRYQEDYGYARVSDLMQKQVIYKGTEQRFYFFAVQHEEEEDTYVGVIGPYPIKGNELYYNRVLLLSEEPVSGKNHSTLVEALAKQISETPE